MAARLHETTALSPLGVATTYAISGRAPVSATYGRLAGGNVTAITDAGPVTTRCATTTWLLAEVPCDPTERRGMK